MQEGDYEFGIAHDRWLANYCMGTETAWCENKTCPNHDGVVVDWYSEYGQSWWEPEDCFLCHGSWLQDQPDDEEDGSEEN